MSRKLIVTIPRFSAAQRGQIADLAAKNGFEALFFDNATQAMTALKEAEVVFGSDAALAKNAPALRWLCTPSAGVNQFMGAEAFAAPEALLTNSSGAYGVTIAEHIIMVTLELLRRQAEYRQVVARREWVRDLPIHAIHGARITLLGTGDIGQQAALRLRAFMPACLVGINRSGKNPEGLFDRIVTQENMDAVLPETDILIASLPGTKATDGMLSAARLALLPQGAYLVNVGRGNLLDEAALMALLQAGHIAGAALDVFATEPLAQDSALWTCPNLLITPHVAGNMTLDYTVQRILELFLADFARYCAGEPLRQQVSRSAGY